MITVCLVRSRRRSRPESPLTGLSPAPFRQAGDGSASRDRERDATRATVGPVIGRPGAAGGGVLAHELAFAPTRDHTVAEQSKNCRYSTNHQVVDADSRRVVIVRWPLPGNRPADCDSCGPDAESCFDHEEALDYNGRIVTGCLRPGVPGARNPELDVRAGPDSADSANRRDGDHSHEGCGGLCGPVQPRSFRA